MAVSATETLDRHALIDELEELDRIEIDWLRDVIIEGRRLDILSEVVLGHTLKPFHKSLQRFQFRHPHSLQLAFRGAGKTTCCTIARAIWYILRDPNVRILIASKTHDFAKDMLKEIKGHLESNERLISIFGAQKADSSDPRSLKWNTEAIEVVGRDRPMKEPTITTVGAEGQVVGKHYDVILCDDLVDEDNSRTPYMRDRVRTFFYKTLVPTLEPDGELHILGTRYHYDDLYGHLMRHEMKGSHQIVRALDDEERSPWPEKFSPEFFKKLRRSAGTIIFNSQYQCDTEAMKGEIFDYDWMIECELEDVPAGALRFIGVDLAISEKEKADKFAMVLIAIHGRTIYVIKHFAAHLTFGKQTQKIFEWFDEYDPVSIGIESNAYQAALAQHVKETRPDVRVTQLITSKDKVTRAWKLSQRFEAQEVRIVKGVNAALIEHLVLFPGHRFKDIFDALDLAVTVGYRRRRRRSGRRKEIGLL